MHSSLKYFNRCGISYQSDLFQRLIAISYVLFHSKQTLFSPPASLKSNILMFLHVEKKKCPPYQMPQAWQNELHFCPLPSYSRTRKLTAQKYMGLDTNAESIIVVLAYFERPSLRSDKIPFIATCLFLRSSRQYLYQDFSFYI